MAADYRQLSIRAPGKRICFWGAPENAERPGASLSEQLGASGANTGNMFIGHGLFHATECEKKAYHPGFEALPAHRFDEEFDLLFIPASNFLNRQLDLEQHYAYFAETRAPIFCFGLGSQLHPGEEISLRAGTERFLHLLGERGGSIGVRGAFTAEVMWKLGIRNLSITGCPSLLGMAPGVLDSLLAARPSLDRLAVNFSNNVRRHALHPEAFAASENALFQRVKNLNSYYVLQNEIPEIEVIAASFNDNPQRLENALARIRTAFDIAPDDEAADAMLRARLRVFFSVPSWLRTMETMTASIGSRFHGNIAAMLAGTPALFLVHDMRTKEMCELLRLPRLSLDRAFSGDELLERLLACDYGPFAQQLRQMQAEWKLFAHRNGLEMG